MQLLLNRLPAFTFQTQWGHVAEWLRNGLQNRVPRFNSGRGLHGSGMNLLFRMRRRVAERISPLQPQAPLL
jgi:hypothetical protein